jgi:hypothetical protein
MTLNSKAPLRFTNDETDNVQSFLVLCDSQIAAAYGVPTHVVTNKRWNNFSYWLTMWDRTRKEGDQMIAAAAKRKQEADKRRADDNAEWDALQEWDADAPPTWHEKGWRVSQWLTPIIISVLLWTSLYMGGSFALHHLIHSAPKGF